MTGHLVLGGAGSGKSGHAERLAARLGAPVVYVATGAVGDEEMAERVAAHRARRPADWTVVESCDLAGVLAETDRDATVLVDDLEGWLVAAMSAAGLLTEAGVAALGADGRERADALVAAAGAWWERARRRPGALVAVAGQPGWGVVPTGAATRRYVDLHGRVVQRLAAAADDVRLIVAGRALPLPADPVPPTDPGRPDESAGSGAAAGAGSGAPPEPGDEADEPRLRDHGDRQVPPGTVDLAVNVLPGPPGWLGRRLAREVGDLAAYPDDREARRRVAARHGRRPEEVVVLAGAAEAFWLLPRVLRPRSAACVHPGFTEPEAALREAGVPVRRVFRRGEHWRLDPGDVPAHADLVVLGRPDNPTGVVDPEASVAALCRPGRTVVVDEAFAEFLPAAEGLASRADLPGLVVLRSPTKLWGLAGLRVGYLLAPEPLAGRLAAARQPWPVSAPALAALAATAAGEAEAGRAERAAEVGARRAHLVGALRAVPGVRVWEGAANYLLLRTPRPDLRDRLLEDGIAVRRGESFPGLDAHHVRVAVPEPALGDRLAERVAAHLREVA